MYVCEISFQLNSDDNLDIMPILEAVQLVSNAVGKTTALMGTKIIPYRFLPKNHTTYYHYDGSLTTPGCQEIVMWYILAEKLTLSEQQVNLFFDFIIYLHISNNECLTR